MQLYNFLRISEGERVILFVEIPKFIHVHTRSVQQDFKEYIY